MLHEISNLSPGAVRKELESTKYDLEKSQEKVSNLENTVCSFRLTAYLLSGVVYETQLTR